MLILAFHFLSKINSTTQQAVIRLWVSSEPLLLVTRAAGSPLVTPIKRSEKRNYPQQPFAILSPRLLFCPPNFSGTTLCHLYIIYDFIRCSCIPWSDENHPANLSWAIKRSVTFKFQSHLLIQHLKKSTWTELCNCMRGRAFTRLACSVRSRESDCSHFDRICYAYAQTSRCFPSYGKVHKL